MLHQEFRKRVQHIYKSLRFVFFLLVIGAGMLLFTLINSEWLTIEKEIPIVDVVEFENGIHLETGFKEGEGLEAVIVSCTPCHSAKLVTQNRATKDGWIGIIKWMQATQNLWDLGENEAVIVDYLAKHYAPDEKGRREPLKDIEWYELKN